MKLAAAAGLVVCASLGRADQVQVFDLSTDFSETHNPFGAWELRKSPGALFTVCQPDYTQDGRNLRVWADAPFPYTAHVPCWSVAHVASDQFQVGDISMHGAEFDRTGTDWTGVLWTAPVTGIATIEGRVWAPTMYGRVQEWTLSKNGAGFTRAQLVSNGVWMRDTAMNFASGSGGPDSLTQRVEPGDRLAFELVSISEGGNLGDGWGLRLVVLLRTCPADFNADWTVDFFDYLDFVGAFAAEDPTADVNGDQTVDFFDYLDFVGWLDSGC